MWLPVPPGAPCSSQCGLPDGCSPRLATEGQWRGCSGARGCATHFDGREPQPQPLTSAPVSSWRPRPFCWFPQGEQASPGHRAGGPICPFSAGEPPGQQPILWEAALSEDGVRGFSLTCFLQDQGHEGPRQCPAPTQGAHPGDWHGQAGGRQGESGARCSLPWGPGLI